MTNRRDFIKNLAAALAAAVLAPAATARSVAGAKAVLRTRPHRNWILCGAEAATLLRTLPQFKSLEPSLSPRDYRDQGMSYLGKLSGLTESLHCYRDPYLPEKEMLYCWR
jgi:hypothetical protein